MQVLVIEDNMDHFDLIEDSLVAESSNDVTLHHETELEIGTAKYFIRAAWLQNKNTKSRRIMLTKRMTTRKVEIIHFRGEQLFTSFRLILKTLLLNPVCSPKLLKVQK